MAQQGNEKPGPISYQESVDIILRECSLALSKVDPQAVDELIEAILAAQQIFFVGVGRVLLSLQGMAKRLAHLDLKTCYVGQITEPAITDQDLLIVGSGSGESLVPVAIAKKARTLGAKIAHIGSNPESSLAPITDVFVRIPVRTKLGKNDEIDSQQPMTSLFEQCLLLFGDALAGMIIERRQLDVKSLWRCHANLE